MYQIDSFLILLRETPVDVCDDNTIRSSFALGFLAKWFMSQVLLVERTGNWDTRLGACAQEFDQRTWWDRLLVILEVITSQHSSASGTGS